MELNLAHEEKGILLPRCAFCNQVPAEGIRGGIKLKRIFLCRQCEWSILTIQTGTADYQQLMNKVKKIFKP